MAIHSRINILLLVILITGSIFISCSVKAPEVKITGEKTALENQVIGTYREIEQDSWTIASVRSTAGGKAPTMSDEKKKVLTAVQNRKFNKDDINEFKRDGVVGENNRGLLVIRDQEKLNKDDEYRKRVQKIVADENKDRQIIRERAVQINGKIAQADDKELAVAFARMYQDQSDPDTWIQLGDGRWIKKR